VINIIKVTLDTNSLIDIEERREGYLDILRLKDLNNKQKIELRVVAISASEKMIDDQRIRNYSLFEKYIKEIELDELKQLYPFMIWGVTFWGKSINGSSEMTKLEEEIHNILFPKIPYHYKDYCSLHNISYPNDHLDKKWLNSRCDSIVLWSHIYYQGDIFVTRDHNYHKQSKKERLIDLGSKSIVTPKEAGRILV
jgi:hypothetical protein